MQGLVDVCQQSRLFQFFFDIDFMFEWSPPCHFRFGSSVLPDCRMSYQPQNSALWIRPLQAELSDNTLALYAPNRFVLDWVRDKYLNNINGLLNDFCGADSPAAAF
ncbi:hypothetical protein LVJ43_00005 [Klebsiella pneumoniae]|nr:hypothetical protein LVJ43_00005 [Klebsiella pneumoniae]